MNKKTKKSSSSQITMPSSFIDSLHLEDTAKQLETLKAIIFNTSESNQAKIEFIKEALLSGRYAIHSDRIAEKLLEHRPALMVEEAEIA